MADQICIKVPQVIGVGECQVVVVSTLTLSHAATEVKRVHKTVRIDNWVVGRGKVLIDGVVHKNVEYERDDHVIGSDKFDVPFNCCLDVPGAEPGDTFQFEFGKVCAEKDELITSVDPSSSRRAHDDPTTTLFEKICVQVVGKVTREVQVTITPATPSVCPPVPAPCDTVPAEA